MAYLIFSSSYPTLNQGPKDHLEVGAFKNFLFNLMYGKKKIIMI